MILVRVDSRQGLAKLRPMPLEVIRIRSAATAGGAGGRTLRGPTIVEAVADRGTAATLERMGYEVEVFEPPPPHKRRA